MDQDQYERIMSAGVELLKQIRPILKKHGLSDGCSPSMLSVCLGAILKFSGTTAGQILTGAELIQNHWEFDPDSPDVFNVLFVFKDN